MFFGVTLSLLNSCGTSQDQGVIGRHKKKKPTRSTDKKVSGARKALMTWNDQRAYPGKAISPTGYMEAYEQTRLMQQGRTNRNINTDPWQLIGPENIGGRTLCLALHPDNPDIIFAGSASGGLWKSITGGVGARAWEIVDTGHPVLGVSHIVFDPADSNVIYIGTGEVYQHQNSTGGEFDRTTRGSYGVGILKSMDGGITWMKSLDWSYEQNRGVWMIAIHPDSSETLYAATTKGVFKSTNAGGNWINIHPTIMVTDIRIHPTDPETLFAACGNFGSSGTGIYRSINSGADWTKLSEGLPENWDGKVQLAISPTSPDIIYASIANVFNGRGLYKSTDKGNIWVKVNSTNYQQYQGWYSHYVVVSPFDENILFTGGIEIWRSTNSGSNLSIRSDWTEAYFGSPPPEGPIGGPHYAHADHHFAVWHPTNPDIIFFASDGGVFKTTNGGDTFESLIGGYATTQFYNGFANSASDQNLAIGGMQDNFTAIYQGEPAWKRVIGGDGCWAAIDTEDDDTMYGCYQNLGVQRSKNGGDTFSDISPPNQGGDVTAFVAPLVLAPSEPDVIYGGRNKVYRSRNEGSSWSATNDGLALDGGNPVMAMDVAPSDSGIVYAATAPVNSRARVFVTHNSGNDWMDITGDFPNLYPADLTVSPENPDLVYITFMGYENSHVFKSENAGKEWQNLSAGLPDVPVSAVILDPADTDIVYVGTDLGVFVSTNQGVTWETFMDGMPIAMVTDLKVFAPDRLIRAVTHGNGIYERILLDPGPTATPTATPTGSGFGVALEISDTYFTPGEIFRLDAILTNSEQERRDVPFFCILQVFDTLYFYPGWDMYPPSIDWVNIVVPTGQTKINILPDFPWPTTGETADDVYFYAAFLTSDMSAIDGDWNIVEWGFGQ
ncbi:hypothetical protein K8T06_00040 [bacterium]|nr:hypothetical protein [bacterium]